MTAVRLVFAFLSPWGIFFLMIFLHSKRFLFYFSVFFNQIQQLFFLFYVSNFFFTLINRSFSSFFLLKSFSKRMFNCEDKRNLNMRFFFFSLLIRIKNVCELWNFLHFFSSGGRKLSPVLTNREVVNKIGTKDFLTSLFHSNDCMWGKKNER